MFDTFVLDVDGTLVDTNYHHTLAWSRAFQRFGYAPPLWRIHRAIGMGGDQLVQEAADESAEKEHGDELREAWVDEFDAFLHEVKPLAGSIELLQELKLRGARRVLASSGKPEHLEHYLTLIDGRRLSDAVTSGEDAEATKPEPDLVEIAMAKVEGGQAVMVGDSVWDVLAATKAGILTLAVLTGGYSAAELREAGAIRVYDSLHQLTGDLDLWTSSDHANT